MQNLIDFDKAIFFLFLNKKFRHFWKNQKIVWPLKIYRVERKKKKIIQTFHFLHNLFLLIYTLNFSIVINLELISKYFWII